MRGIFERSCGSGLPTTITDDHTPAWGQAFPIFVGNHSRDLNLSGVNCQQPPGSGPKMFSAGCTMNIGWKKLSREITWRFCRVQRANTWLLLRMYWVPPFVTKLPSVPEQQNAWEMSLTFPPEVPREMGRA